MIQSKCLLLWCNMYSYCKPQCSLKCPYSSNQAETSSFFIIKLLNYGLGYIFSYLHTSHVSEICDRVDSPINTSHNCRVLTTYAILLNL